MKEYFKLTKSTLNHVLNPFKQPSEEVGKEAEECEDRGAEGKGGVYAEGS